MKKRIAKAVNSIHSGAKKAVSPLTNTNAWKFLRKKVLRSPFRGYFVQSWQEVRKVEWPDRKTSIKLTVVVVVFSLLFSVFTTSLDYGFEKLARQLFLN